jgi:hypothetical protein
MMWSIKREGEMSRKKMPPSLQLLWSELGESHFVSLDSNNKMLD